MTLLQETLDPWLEELRRADYAPATVARYASAARRFLAWYENEERRLPTLSDLTPIALVGYRAALQRQRATSTTNVHLAALRWGDLELRQRAGTVLIRAGKGNKARMVPLNGSVRAALVDYLAPFLECEATAAAVAERWGMLTAAEEKRPLWPSQKGGPLGATGIWRVYKRIAADCVARDLAPADTTSHDLRHTFAHRYLEKHPRDLVGLAHLLGHESLNTTKVYVILNEFAYAVEVEPALSSVLQLVDTC